MLVVVVVVVVIGILKTIFYLRQKRVLSCVCLRVFSFLLNNLSVCFYWIFRIIKF